MKINEKQIRQMVREELTRADVRSIFSGESEELLKNQKFEKRVHNIVADVLEELLDSIWRKKSFWKGTIKRN